MEYLVHFDELDSTNTYLKQNWESLPQGIVVTTNKQSAGRGRYNRVWVSQEGGLYFSVLLKPTQQDFLPNLTILSLSNNITPSKMIPFSKITFVFTIAFIISP
jgi:BirA family biotin operon repressor/biotin-[acetyl-CoA-carboxylase] ligase